MADEGVMLTYLTIVLALAINPPVGFDPTPILDAIEKVETGGQRDPANAIGDGGKALGPLQIHRVYWVDAVDHDPSLVANGETYDSVRDRAYARRVVMAYWSRYAKSWDSETLARIHNGGPKGHRKAATLGYWAKVRAKLGS
jgi:hypothetical protein